MPGVSPSTGSLGRAVLGGLFPVRHYHSGQNTGQGPGHQRMRVTGNTKATTYLETGLCPATFSSHTASGTETGKDGDKDIFLNCVHAGP